MYVGVGNRTSQYFRLFYRSQRLKWLNTFDSLKIPFSTSKEMLILRRKFKIVVRFWFINCLIRNF